tara:strand:+ start:1890 stop:3344 length:1455 start_codon:yes stop_codon:yes gene_type:complete
MKKYILFILSLFVIFSCKKDDVNIYKSGDLKFSVDTIIFDTLFSSIGSTTHELMIYNNNNYDINTNIKISGNSGANFRMNIDGISGNNINDILIPSNDSIYLFIEVTVDPNNTNTPYLISDSIIFTNNNNNIQKVNLIAYGQDAYFHTSNNFGNIINNGDTSKFFYHQISNDETWTNDKPHVIYGYVIVDPNCTLTIEEGSSIYLHKNSGIIVGNPFSGISGGTIKINGSLGNEVTFRGDRLDSWYDSIPGQWDRIWLYPGSINNEFNYVNFQNGTIAIHIDTLGNNQPTAKINNCKIDNMSAIGILGQGTNIEVNNTIITKCGQYSIVCNFGGNYKFKHCTFANFWNFDRRNNPSILLNNYYEGSDGNIYSRDLENVYFGNCIIYGSLSTEISLQESKSADFNYTFDHCLIKIDTSEIVNSNFINVLFNEDPGFVNKKLFDFNLQESSICVASGDFNITDSEPILSTNIDGINRNNNPNLGAY